MDYTKCIHCGSKKPSIHEREEWFLYCSKKCKVEKDEKALEARLKEKETHNPWDRMTEAEREEQRRLLNTSGPVVWTREVFEAAKIESGGGAPKKRADGKLDGRSKGMRKCGKCGETGHNARTCGEHGKRTVSLASAIAARNKAKAAEDAPESVSNNKVEERAEKKKEWSREAVRASKRPSKPQRKQRKKEKKGSRTCGNCGKKGHNARTCKA